LSNLKINFNEIPQLFPSEGNKNDEEARKQLFELFDTNKTGLLTFELIMQGYKNMGKRA